MNFYRKNLSSIQKCIFNEILYLFEKKNNFTKINSIFNPSTLKLNNKFDKNFSYLKNLFINYIENNYIDTKETKINNGYSYTFLKNEKYYKCFLNIDFNNVNSCKILTINEYENYISSSSTPYNNGELSFDTINLGNLDYSTEYEILKLSNFTDKEYILKEDKIYILNEINKNPNTIRIIFSNDKARLIISGEYKNTQFDFVGITNKNSNSSKKYNSRNDGNFLNGCTNFINADLKNISIKFTNFFFEDAINFISSNGSISNIMISNSIYDSLDIDFSNIEISNTKIYNSGNDVSILLLKLFLIQLS